MDMDPEARAYLDSVAASGLPPVFEVSPEHARRNVIAGIGKVAGAVEELPVVEDRVLAGVPVRLYRPAASSGPLPVTLYFHGGGWVTGNLDTHDALCRRLATASDSLLIAVDYRLAPEHPYPAAVEDVWAVTSWVASHAPEIGADEARIAVAGDSAGGNLAAVAAVRARDSGIPLRMQVLAYPVIDADLETPSYRANGEGYGLEREAMRWYWRQYCPDEARRAEPEASPLRAGDLSGVAPAYVLVCELDPLHDEGLAYARRLEEAGVPVRLRREDGMIHGFLRLSGPISRGYGAAADIAGELRAAFAKGMAEAAHEA
jgi:acetyl esterase